MGKRNKEAKDTAKPVVDDVAPTLDLDGPEPNKAPKEPAKKTATAKKTKREPTTAPGTSKMVQGRGARDPNRIPPSGELAVQAATWAAMTASGIAPTSRAGFAAWARTSVDGDKKTPSEWKTLHTQYLARPVGR